MTTERPFSLHARVREHYVEGEAVSPSQITDAVLASLSPAEVLAAMRPALSAYVSRFVSQMRSAGVAGMDFTAVRPDPAEGTSASRRPPAGVPAANPVVNGRKKSGYDTLAEALSVRLHVGPGVDDWVVLGDARPEHLRFVSSVNRRAAEGHLASAARYERWADMVERARVPTFGKLAADVLAAELLRTAA